MEKQETNKSAQGIIDFVEVAEKIAAAPSQWVLFLGHGISYHKPGYRRQKFFEMAREIEKSESEKYSVHSMLYQSIENKDYIGLSDVLFGDIWDGGSLLEDNQEKQQKRREKYANDLVKREEINLDNMNMHLEYLLRVFSGIILTTCQDETVEAFLEYENSMSADDLVHTPYTMTTSSIWDWWIKNGCGDVSRLFSQAYMPDVHILVKLYGTGNRPHRLLLSKQDFKEFYPAVEEKQGMLPQNMLFLQTIFNTKNVLFLGVDFSNDCALPLAKGILDLLSADISPEVERYAFTTDISKEDTAAPDIMKKYHIQPIRGMSAAEELNRFRTKERKRKLLPLAEEEEHKELSLEEALKHFGKWYIRRPYREIFPEEQDIYDSFISKELEILKNDILGFNCKTEKIGKWSVTSVRQLAIAANNLADFYDLKKVFDAAVTSVEQSIERDNIQFYETVTEKILNDRLSHKSQQLRQILSAYGSGFPLGFLQLLTDDEEELKEWKRAGICLTNSGMYISHNYRKYVQTRMSYADNVMQTAGTYPDQKREQFRSRMEESCHQVINSYFYPVDKKTESSVEDKCLTHMLRKLRNILEDRRDGYQQIHSLLQTETQSIISIMEKLEDKTLEWKPSLFYCLLLESCMVPPNCNIAQIDHLLAQLEKLAAGTTKEEKERLFGEKIKLTMAKIIIMNQSLGKEGLVYEKEKSAIEKQCDEVEQLIEQWNTCKDIIPEWLFRLKIQFFFLKCKMYGHLSTIVEIKRCKKGKDTCKEQKEILDTLKETLETIDGFIRNREHVLGGSYGGLTAEYNHLMGEYYFKMSQYYWENRRFAKENSLRIYQTEEKCYHDAEMYYKKALRYYNKYTFKFEIQRANIMRNLADLYCRQRISFPKDEAAASLKEKLYDLLIEAYVLYRNHSDLHGIANVLQSMGNAETYDNNESGKDEHRSPFTFHKVAVDIYEYLGDAWSRYVVLQFQEGIFNDRIKNN